MGMSLWQMIVATVLSLVCPTVFVIAARRGWL